MSEQAHHRREEAVVSLAAEVLRKFGEFEFVARGSSMIPSVFPGDTLIIRKETPESARAGDVVLCARGERFYAHRLVRKTEENGMMRLITRGDALDQNDAPFAESELLGRVAVVIRRGKRVDPSERRGAGLRTLGWIARHSDFGAKCLLHWHALRGGPSRNSRPARRGWLGQESA